ncbi:MAG: hypothetical protein ACI93G_000706, partial [Hyphomonas sp.]
MRAEFATEDKADTAACNEGGEDELRHGLAAAERVR